MTALLLILLSAVLVNVIVITHIGAWRPFVGVVDTYQGSLGIALAVLLVMPLAAALSYAFSRGILWPLGLSYLRTPATFAIVIALASLAGPCVRRIVGLVPGRPGFTLLMMTNAALPGVAFVADERARGLGDAILIGSISAVAFAGMLLAFAALYERLRLADVPQAFRHAPLAFVTCGIVALGFMGFAGLVQE